MKASKALMICLLILALGFCHATIEEHYTFTSTAGTYTPVTGTAVTGISSDDAISGAIALGMVFPYGENSFNEIKVSSNGWIGLGSTQTGSNLSNQLVSTTTLPVLAPLWDDTSLSGGSCEYMLSGTAPNRVFTVQYNNLRWNYSGTNQFNLQVLLYETGKIEFIYGSSTGTPNSPSASIGINMTPGGAGWFFSVTPGNPATASTTTENSSISSFPAQGTIYQFNPALSVPNDLAGISVTGNPTPTANVSSPFQVTVRNRGTAPQTAYQVKLYRGAGMEVASIDGTPIQPGQNITFTLNWTPTQAGAETLYGKVILAGDENPANDQTPIFNVNVMPPGVFQFVVGSGDELARMPLDFYWKNSLFQTLYYPAEMNNFMGQILGIRFWNNFYTDLPAKPTKVWIGTTPQTDLSAGWIPSTQLTLVFDGTVNYPSGANQIEIPFNQPYMYLNGENLVLMVNRPMDTIYFSSQDQFLAQTAGTARTLNVYSDSSLYDPAAPPAGITPNGQFPKTGFIVIPGGVGHVQGTVTGAGGVPLANVAIQFTPGGYSATTDAQGHFAIQNLLPDTYSVSCSVYGYQNATQSVTIVEDQTSALNVSMTPLPVVAVTGSVIGSDTQAGINGALIHLEGYADYDANSNAAGAFAIPAVYANNTYAYTIIAPGYNSVTGTLSVAGTDYTMGTITLSEIAYAPHSVVAEVSGTGAVVNINWQAPDPNATEITESFESDTFPPQNWTQYIVNTGPANSSGVLPTWCRLGAVTVSGTPANPTEGNYQAGLWWDYGHQDEWLFTPLFNCPPAGYLVFDTYAFFGSTNADHYFVKVSNDNGNNWTTLWDASEQTGGWNHYATPVTIDLGFYSGQQIKLAFNAVDGPSNDGLWYVWFIDDIYIGNALTSERLLLPVISHTETTPAPMPALISQRAYSRAVETGLAISEPSLPVPSAKAGRSLLGYRVWRLALGNEDNEASWVLLTPNTITATGYQDTAWGTLPNDAYRWAVKAVYTNGVQSVPSFSNSIVYMQETGFVAGVVRRVNTSPIVGATVSAGSVSATTNSAGAYTLILPVGTYAVTCSATGFLPQTVEGVVVSPDQTTTQNFVLSVVDNEDDVIPVSETVLLGNWPNPVRSTTEIRYELKEPSPLSLDIFNTRGQLIRRLVAATQDSGRHSATWDGRDSSGNAVSSGIYFYRLTAGNYVSQRKLLLTRN